MISELVVGANVARVADGATVDARCGKGGELIIGHAYGRYHEAVSRGNVYVGANQTGCVWTVGLATTYTGMCVSNPLGSGKNLSILAASFAEVVAPAGIQMVYLAGGKHGSTNVVAGVAGIPLPMLVGSGNTPVGKCWTGATLPVAPDILLLLQTGKTSAALSTTSTTAWSDVGGLIEVMPGGFVILGCFTVGAAVGQYGCIIWEEILN